MKILFALITALFLQAAHAELVVVANKQAPIDSLTRSELSRLFLGQAGSYPNGSPAIPLDVSGDYRKSFYTYVLQRDPTQVEKYWARMIFTGKAQPPREVRQSEVKSVVAETRGAISYLDKALVDDSLKIITIKD